MSRIGKQQYEIPANTEVTLADNFVIVKGPLGELKRELRPEIEVKIEDNKVLVNPTNNSPFAKALWGTFASHIINMIQGVSTLYEKKLILEGVGFKSEVKGNKLVLALGFSHLVEIDIPEGLKVTAEKNNITVSGIDKELVGQFASKTRMKKKAEPYKGKGFRYEGEIVRRKQGKKNV
ncbi:MAG: 50S ribosomal protein L6 [Candidatus Pacebacteria bacterium]|nr:50S ribosomal protein L6 [Candidatus Paceibacterota bacterium]